MTEEEKKIKAIKEAIDLILDEGARKALDADPESALLALMMVTIQEGYDLGYTEKVMMNSFEHNLRGLYGAAMKAAN